MLETKIEVNGAAQYLYFDAQRWQWRYLPERIIYSDRYWTLTQYHAHRTALGRYLHCA